MVKRLDQVACVPPSVEGGAGMSATRPIALGCLLVLALLCHPHAAMALIIPFQSAETGTYLFTLTSPTTNHSVAIGTGSGTLGAFQSTGSQDSDFTDPLHQTVQNGHFTQSYAGGTLFGSFMGTAAVTGPTSGVFSLVVPSIGGTGALSGVVGGTGTATGTFEFVSVNPDQTQNFTYTLTLTAGLVVPEPSTLWLLGGGLAGLAIVGSKWRRGVSKAYIRIWPDAK